LAEYDLNNVLKECKKYASVGYEIASSQYKNLNNTLSNAAETINGTLMDFNSSPCYVSSATDLLSQQLVEIKTAFNNLSFAFKEDLENLRENLSKFSITLFGRTMAGKSTLMEILTEGDGESIGHGAQRTTRDIRKYEWNGLEITDVPGIGAFEGEDDEQIAFEAAKTADLILFLITDDAPQASEAECFGRIVNLGKPVICIMNIKVSASEGKNVKLLIRDIEKRFDMNRLNDIRKQFLSYSKQLGQDWGYVPFVYVHLKSAFMAQNTEDSQLAETLYRASRIDYLKAKIVEQVRDKGNFYRIKTFIDIISNPMLSSMERLLNQSLLNSAQGRIVLSKKRQLVVWKDNYAVSGKKRIHSLIVNIKSQLNGEIASFAEEHYADKNADKAWNKLLKDRQIQRECQDVLARLESECNDKIKEVSREITQELNFTASFAGDRSLRMNQIIDGKRVWDWSATIVGGGLSIAAIITGACGASIAGPLGWAALAVGAIGVAVSFIFKSRDKKEQEARMRLESSLRKNVDSVCESLEKQMLKNFTSLIDVRIESLLKELDRMNAVVFKLADTQKDLAWNLDNHLLELNSQIVTEAIKLIGAEGLEYHIQEVARVPGNAVMFMLNDGTFFPEEQKKLLHKLMSESIGFVYYSDSKRVLISRVLGKTIERDKIDIEDKIGVAHIPLEGATPYIRTRVRMAQQFTKIAIIE
jgi:GTP-binding protein EngB required for normal cell division